MLNYKIIIQVFGVLLLILGGFMLLPVLFSLMYGSDDLFGFLKAILICGVVGLVFSRIKPKSSKIGKREGYLVVTFGWIVLCIFSSLPYMLSGELTDFSKALFESTSGLTTTGASVFSNIEELPQGILLWRSLTQWIGGMGIIVLTVAIFPLLGIGGVELFVAEAPGPTSDKIHPRIKETAKRLWIIYVALTGILAILLFSVGGLNSFDALNHALTTMSTGGFSTKNDSLAHFGPIVHYIVMLFMFFAGMNYALIYLSLKGKFKRVWSSDELKTYVIGLLSLSFIVTIAIHLEANIPFEQSFREGTFQILSIVTTTGFVTADYTAWSPFLTMMFFFLLFTGACAGSTSGGIKVIRHLVFYKNALLEFKRMLHPKGMIRLKIDKNLVAPKIVTHILVFFMIYLLLFGVSSLLMSMVFEHSMEEPLFTALGAVATCLGNVGPAIGSVGPVDNFAEVPAFGKIYLAGLMIVGRLELFTVLVIFTPFFWKAN